MHSRHNSLRKLITVVVLAAAFLALNPAKIRAQLTFDTIALTGDAAPGTGVGISFGGFGTPTINDNGQTAFSGQLSGTAVDSTNNSGIWSENASSLNLVARSGDAAPGTGVNYSAAITPVLNNTGHSAFLGRLTGTSVDNSNNQGIWSEAAGSIGSPGLVARNGNAAPGTATGVNFNFLTSPVFNNAGQTVFFSTLSGTGVNSSNDRGIWSEAAGSIGSPSLIARAGDAAPGTTAGINFSSFGNPRINDAGQAAFRGFLTGTGVNSGNNSGIWSEAAGSIGSPGLVARAGDAAPGTGTGVNFSLLLDPTINSAGQTAFGSALGGTGVDSSNNTGIWSEAAGSIGNPGLVARTGDAAPGTSPGVNYSNLFNALVLNDAGQTAFRGSLAGTGVDSNNNEGIWSEAAGSIGSPGLVAREGSAAPGTEPGVNFSGFTDPLLNDAGQIAFSGFLTGTGVDGSNRQGIWATDPNGMLTLVVRTGDLFDVNDDPSIQEFRTLASVGIYSGLSRGNGQPSSFNDAGQIAFAANFTDGSSGVFVANITAIPEPTSLAMLGLCGIIALSRRRRKSNNGQIRPTELEPERSLSFNAGTGRMSCRPDKVCRPFAWLPLIALSTFGLAGWGETARADIVIDQVADAFGTSDPGMGGPTIDEFQSVFQTFTVGIGGVLDRLDVQVQHGSGGTPNSDLTLTMRRTLANGEPNRTQDLGTTSLTAGQVPVFDNFASGPYTSFDVSGLNINVLPGDVLAFELSSSTTFDRSYFIYDSQTDIYAEGVEYIFGPVDGAFFSTGFRDLGFRSWVAVPEPSALAILTPVILLSVSRRSRRRR